MMKTIKRTDTLALFKEVIAGNILRVTGLGNYYNIRMEIVPNAWYNEDQTDVVEGPVILYNYNGSSTIQLDYREFIWLLDVIFKGVESFDIIESKSK